MIVVVLCILLIAVPLCMLMRTADKMDDDEEQEKYCKTWKDGKRKE